MPDPIDRRFWASTPGVVLSAAALGVLFFAFATLGIDLTRTDGRIAALWIPNAIVVSWLFKARRGHWVMIAAAFCGNVLANWFAGDPAWQILGLSTLNMIEVLAVWRIVAWLGSPRPDFGSNADLARFAAAAMAATTLSATGAALLLEPGFDSATVERWGQWWRGDALGLLLVTPALSILLDAVRRRARPSKRQLAEFGGLVLVATATGLVTFWQTSYPFLFLAMPVALLFALRLGPVGSTLATGNLAFVATFATWAGHGPITLVKGDLADQLLTLQLFLATALLISLPFAALMRSKERAEASMRSTSESLLDAQRTFETLAKVSPAGIFRTNRAGACTFVNAAWLQLSGLTREQALGAGWAHALHEEDRDRVFSGWHDAVAQGRPFADDFRFVRDDNDICWVQVLASAETDEDGTILGYVGVTVDITGHKRLEARLEEARAQAEAAARAKTEFLANMSHEIRTPMNGVLGFTDLLLDTDLDDAQRRFTSSLAEAGKAMMSLLNDILDISKIEAGKLEIVDGPVEIRHKIDSCIRLFEPVAEERGIALRCSVADDVPKFVTGDRLRLRQILVNLIGNAVKFTHEGEVTLSARAIQEDGENRLEIAVTDTGIGIAREKVDLIFGQFSQADGSIGRSYGGTGLGLTICANLVRLMGGTLSVASIEGEGSTFTIDLPLREAQQRRSATRPADHVFAARLADRSVRLLVAEDNDLNRSLIEEMLARGGISPDFAVDGAQAVKLVHAAAERGKSYDLVLMDVQMPEVNGLMATRQLRALGFDAETLPIVALTANCYAEDIAQCRAAGMQGHIAKPVQLPVLMQTIARHVAGSEDAPRAVKRARRTQRAVLADQYRDRRTKLAAELRSVCESGEDIEWAAIRRQLHQMAGTAAYFGEGPLGELARRLERELDLTEDEAERRRIVMEEAAPLREAA